MKRFVVIEKEGGARHECGTRLDCCVVIENLGKAEVTIRDLVGNRTISQDVLPWATYARERKLHMRKTVGRVS